MHNIVEMSDLCMTVHSKQPLKNVGHCAGLVAGVFLLGYGLVEIPRGMWNEANPEDRLRSACYRCALLSRCI